MNLASLLLPEFDTPNFTTNDLSGLELLRQSRRDHRLDKPLSIAQFYQAFGIYKRIMCEAFPQRRLELDLYEADIGNICQHYGDIFYQYHVRFSRKLRPTWKRESKLIGQEGSKKNCSSWLEVLNLKFVITVRKVIMNPPFVHHRSMFLEFQRLRRLSLIRGQLSMTQGLTDKAVLKRHILVQKFATTSMLKVVISKFVISSIFVRSVNHLIMGSPNVCSEIKSPNCPTQYRA